MVLCASASLTDTYAYMQIEYSNKKVARGREAAAKGDRNWEPDEPRESGVVLLSLFHAYTYISIYI